MSKETSATHAWKVGDHLTIEVVNRSLYGTDGKRHVGPAALEPFIAEELLRLAERVRDLEGHNAVLQRGWTAAADQYGAEVSRAAALEDENRRLQAVIERPPLVPVEPIIAVSIKAGEGAERQRIVEYLRAKVASWPSASSAKRAFGGLADLIASGKKLDPSKLLLEEAALCTHPDMIETQEGPLDV